MAAIYANNVAGTLGANVGPSDTLLLLGSGQGVNWPSLSPGDYYYATVVHLTTGAVEVVQVTSRSADTLTVVRGRDSTNAIAFTAGSVIEMRTNAQVLREMDWRNYANQNNGVLQLDGSGLVPDARLPAGIMRDTEADARYVLLDSRGAANGVATLDATTKIPLTQIPALAYIPTSGGQATGTIVSGTTSGELRVGGQGAGNAGTVFRFDGTIGFTLAGAVTAAGFRTIWTAHNFDPNSKYNASGGDINGGVNVKGGLTADADLFVRRSGAAGHGLAYFGNANSDFILMDGSNWSFGGGKNVFANDFISTSDARLKDISGYFAPEAGISRLLNIAEWTMLADGVFGRGPVAQDVQKYAPKHIIERDGVLHVNKTALAFDFIYDLNQRLTALEARNAHPAAD